MLEKFSYPGLDSRQCDRFEQWALLLEKANRVVNLTRITAPQEVYLRHFADSLQLLSLLDRVNQPKTLIDIGSGAGLPGLALAIARPDWQVLSVEATEKKVRFQQEVIDGLGLTNAKAIKGRAEDLAHDPTYREQFSVVTARAVADLRVLMELCVPLIRTEGLLLAMKGSNAQQEILQASSALDVLGCSLQPGVSYRTGDLAGRLQLSLPEESIDFHVVVLQKERGTPGSFPRRYNMIKKQPL